MLNDTNQEIFQLQQYLPFTVLKRFRTRTTIAPVLCGPVATVLTVYGIETFKVCILFLLFIKLQQYLPFTVLKQKSTPNKYTSLVATVLTVYGIETQQLLYLITVSFYPVATVLTVYGIETLIDGFSYSIHSSMLQQYLPFTVLKLSHDIPP